VLLVLALFALLVGRGLQLGLRGVDVGQHRAGYIAFGVSLVLGLQALVSVGVNLGVLPTKGLTLPLISSGGSSTLMTCIMLGVLVRAGYEIHRAEATRQMATRRHAPESADGVPATMGLRDLAGSDASPGNARPAASRNRPRPAIGGART
jgi:cell division protein FtsW